MMNSRLSVSLENTAVPPMPAQPQLGSYLPQQKLRRSACASAPLLLGARG